jgi:hypothetical protein
MTKEQAEREINRLRSEARIAYLDGRMKRAKELNRKADLLWSPWRAMAMLAEDVARLNQVSPVPQPYEEKA